MHINDKQEELIALLEELLRNGGINKVFYITPDPVQAVPQAANLSRNDRLAIPFGGCHRMEIPFKDGVSQLTPVRHDATFMPKGCWNKPDWQLPVKVVTFGFNIEDFTYSFVECGINEHSSARGRIRWCNSDGQVILELMRKIFAGSADYLHTLPLTETLLAYCLESLKTRFEAQHGKAYSTYANICSYLEDSYSSDLSRAGVAGLFKISSNYLSNLFKSQSSTSFSAHINQLRIKRACHLLRHFNQTLDEVAFSCGYHETGYFCRVFKKNMGCTPGEFRRRN